MVRLHHFITLYTEEKRKFLTSKLVLFPNQEIEHGAVSNLDYLVNFIGTKRMTRSKTDRSTESVSHIRWEKIIKPKQWLERCVAEIDRNRKKNAHLKGLHPKNYLSQNS